MISITVLCVAPDLDAQNACICVARVGLRDGSRTALNGGYACGGRSPRFTTERARRRRAHMTCRICVNAEEGPEPLAVAQNC